MRRGKLEAILDSSTVEQYGPGWHGTYRVHNKLALDCGVASLVGGIERDHRFTGTRIVRRPFYVAFCKVDQDWTDAGTDWNDGRHPYTTMTSALAALQRHVEHAHADWSITREPGVDIFPWWFRYRDCGMWTIERCATRTDAEARAAAYEQERAA